MLIIYLVGNTFFLDIFGFNEPYEKNEIKAMIKNYSRKARYKDEDKFGLEEDINLLMYEDTDILLNISDLFYFWVFCYRIVNIVLGIIKSEKFFNLFWIK